MSASAGCARAGGWLEGRCYAELISRSHAHACAFETAADPLHGTGIDTKPSSALVRVVRPRLERNAAPLTPSAPAPICRAMSLRPRPLPVGFIRPCLPTSAPCPPSGNGWLHEIKHDGFRKA